LIKKVVIFTFLPMIFLLLPLSYLDSMRNFWMISFPILLFFLFNVYLDVSGKSLSSKKLKGFSAYLMFLLVSIYSLVPAIVIYKDTVYWLFILIWLIVAIVAYVKREFLVKSILPEKGGNPVFKWVYWLSVGFIILAGGGGGSYGSRTLFVNSIDESFRLTYYSYIFFLFSLWVLILAQSSIAKFTKFKN